jgi:phosphate transport system ATP-binding protein
MATQPIELTRLARARTARFGDPEPVDTTPAPQFQVRDLNFCYGETHALRDITLTLPAQRVTGLIGPSGCGKSTFLRTLNRMFETVPGAVVTSGDVLLDGVSIFDFAPTLLRRRVGMVFQKPSPFPKTIFENVAYGLRANGLSARAELEARVVRSLERAALWNEVKDKLNVSALSLSGGQQQRLCIARALAVEPEVLLLDEPCSALDPIATAKIEDLIFSLRRDCTVIMVTHNMLQAARIADYVGFFLEGQLIEFGGGRQIFQHPSNKLTEDYITGRFG